MHMLKLCVSGLVSYCMTLSQILTSPQGFGGGSVGEMRSNMLDKELSNSVCKPSIKTGDGVSDTDTGEEELLGESKKQKKLTNNIEDKIFTKSLIGIDFSSP